MGTRPIFREIFEKLNKISIKNPKSDMKFISDFFLNKNLKKKMYFYTRQISLYELIRQF
jgi:hypothetical protein